MLPRSILPKYPGGTSIDDHASIIGFYLSGMAAENLYVPFSLPSHIYYTIFTWFQKSDEEDPAQLALPPVMELIQELDIDAIAVAIAENVRRALYLKTPLVNYVDSPEEHMISSSSRGHTFLQIGNTELNKAICQIIDQLLRWQRKRGLHPPMADSAEVNLFQKGYGNGPTSADFRLDWEQSPHKGWNLVASFVFADYFLQWLPLSPLENLIHDQVSRAALSLAFRKRFYRLQGQFWKSVTSDQVPVQNAPSLSVLTDNQARRERRRRRKKKRFENRQDIVLAHPEWDSAYWEAHEALGVDGTSSDESENETHIELMGQGRRRPDESEDFLAQGEYFALELAITQ
ncbi:hypothetical protein M422DRAFT_275811 [Sphaerobolus stellatus SS14]|uniref:Uncharacterized protein n=1 Tax=Sphaerobolus stellatus (strain SS14) TaxID=990650 RepID=A0A0C9T3X7_SPHS4|nr:hypothetical protein M422DRAFT_275811 [Sphaerobolus stellatus SS14]